jgi:hypothetical protein
MPILSQIPNNKNNNIFVRHNKVAETIIVRVDDKNKDKESNNNNNNNNNNNDDDDDDK